MQSRKTKKTEEEKRGRSGRGFFQQGKLTAKFPTASWRTERGLRESNAKSEIDLPYPKKFPPPLEEAAITGAVHS